MEKASPNQGELIKTARKNKGLTQKQLAEKTGLAAVTIQQYERNLRQPRLENIKKIAEALDTTVAYLMDWKEKESLSNVLAENIKTYRKNLGISKKSLSVILGKSVSYVEALENGSIIPSQDELQILSNCFEIPVKSFWTAQGQIIYNSKADHVAELLYKKGYLISEYESLSEYVIQDKNKGLLYTIDSKTFKNFLNSVNDYFLYSFDKMLSQFEPKQLKKQATPPDQDEPEALDAANDRGATPEEKKNADDIMHNPDEWE